MTTTEINVIAWTTKDVANWLQREGFNSFVIRWICDENEINGKCLLALNETDFNSEPLMRLSLKDRKLLLISIKLLQRDNQSSLMQLGLIDTPTVNLYSHHHHYLKESDYCDSERLSPPASEDGGRSQRLPPEIWKAFLSFCYVIGVTWITAIVMVIVHDRVPDMKKYPPLPDIFLDNVPHIPWAFDMCEVTGTVMMFIWIIVLVFHKHRFILMRRFFALSGTVFLLRCVTMLITSLSVPGAHLQCQPKIYSLQDENASFYDDLKFKLAQAYIIWRGAGMSIQGVRTCGDYMFSGHTVALTMLNFFITEYTPRHFYFLHTLTWMMNMFGIFFILAAHEHYSIDVFVAFYISSRLFLYYHTLSNNQALMQRDSNRTRVWFPLFSYFEASVDGIVPNEYNTPTEIIVTLKDFLMAKFSEVRSYHMQLTRQHMMQRPQSQQQQQQCNNNAEDKVDVLNNYDGSDIKEISADGGVKMKVC